MKVIFTSKKSIVVGDNQRLKATIMFTSGVLTDIREITTLATEVLDQTLGSQAHNYWELTAVQS